MRNKGITLVALVITIIILIILAGITLSILVGEGGLINKAQQGTSEYKNEAIKESVNLAVVSAMANQNGELDINVLRQQLNEQIGEGKYNLSINDETGEVTITVESIEYKVTKNGTVTGENSNNEDDPATGNYIAFNDNNIRYTQNFRVDLFCTASVQQYDANYQNGEVIFDFTEDDGHSYRAIASEEKIDLSNCIAIGVEYEVTQSMYGASVGIYNNNYRKDFLLGNDDSGNYVIEKMFDTNVGTHMTYLDVSNYNGQYNIAVTSWRGVGDTKGIFKIKNICLIKKMSMPVMTDDTTVASGYGTMVATSSELQDEKSKPYRAFDGLTNSSDNMEVWHSSTTTPQWIQLQLPSQTKIEHFAIINRNWYGADNVSKFVLYGSNNGTDWTNLTDECNNSTESEAKTYFKVKNPGNYYYYKWNVTATTSGYAIIDEIIFADEIKK